MEATNALESGPKGFTILYRILTAMMLIAVIPIGGLWFISVHKAKQDWTENVFQALVQDTSALANRVDEWTEFNLRLLPFKGLFGIKLLQFVIHFIDKGNGLSPKIEIAFDLFPYITDLFDSCFNLTDLTL